MRKTVEPDPVTTEIEELRKELSHMRRMAEACTAQQLTNEIATIAIRHELEQRRSGFRLMADLAIAAANKTEADIFVLVSKRLNPALHMQRTIVLLPDGADGMFKANILHGYPLEERKEIEKCRISIDKELLDSRHPVIVTNVDPATRFKALRETLRLPYFIAAPVLINNEAVALQIIGRIYEQPPYLPRLDKSDAETLQTVNAYIMAILIGQKLRQAENLSKLDPLTNLLNLRGITEHLRHTLAIARRDDFPVAILFVDLDHFKTINDTYGHAIGDLALQITAKRITGCIRHSDFVSRIGGDEFIVALPHINQPADAALVAQKIINSLSQQIDINNQQSNSCRISVSASIGIAVFPDHGSNETDLIQAADKAMYSIKRSGKNAYAYAE